VAAVPDSKIYFPHSVIVAELPAGRAIRYSLFAIRQPPSKPNINPDRVKLGPLLMMVRKEYISDGDEAERPWLH
jgi:hypothetical protein